MENRIKSPADLMEAANGYRLSRIILTGHELGIFTILKTDSLTSGEVAKIISTDPRGTDRLMNALVAIGLLEKSAGRFSNTELSKKHLVAGSPGYLGGLSHVVSMWRNWNNLTESVRTGHSVCVEEEEIGDRSDPWLRNFIAAMHSRGISQAKEVAGLLDFRNVKRILDVGGGSGVFAFEFLRRCKDATAVVFDLPGVVPITKEYIKAGGWAGKVTTAPGDYLKTEFGTGFDQVFLSAVIHINDPDENLLLIKKSADALNQGGQVIISDHIMDESRTKPAMGAIFALNMLSGTKHGDTYTESEIRSWMEAAGLLDVKRLDATEDGRSLMTGRKI